MAIKSSKEIASWNGDPALWGDHARKVRLQWSMTSVHKRKLLRPDLASRLTDGAWAVKLGLDYKKLSKRNGTKYLLRYLQDRLCRPIFPDVGARLEDLLIRLRRPLDISMSQWSNEMLESYRRVQRTMIRACQ